MSDDEGTSGPVDVKRKGVLGYICAKLKSRFLWIIVVYMEVLLTQYVLLTYLTPFFPTVAEGMGSSSSVMRYCTKEIYKLFMCYNPSSVCLFPFRFAAIFVACVCLFCSVLFVCLFVCLFFAAITF